MMIFNRLTIKCENPIKLAQIRELLVEEDEYQREIFTMKKLLPVAEKKSISVCKNVSKSVVVSPR